MYVLRGGGMEDRENERDIVGAVTSVSFRPGARYYSLEFGTERDAQLAFFEVDVPHVLHVTSYCDYLHEAFHLIFNRLSSTEEDYRELDDVMSDRVSEIFAILLSQICLFGSDVESAWYHYVGEYSKSVTSMGTDERDTIVKFTEQMICLFFALDAVEGMEGLGLRDKPLRWTEASWHRNDKDPSDAAERFQYWVCRAGPFFSRHEEFWKEGYKLDARGYCINEFKSIYPKVAKIMPKIWSDTTDIFTHYLNSLIADTDTKYEQVNKEVADMVREGLSKGAPLIRSKYLSAMTEDEGVLRENEELDPLFLICKLLYSCMSRIKEAKNKEVHLCREHKDKCAKFPKKDKKWHDFLVEQGAAAMFCSVPESRRERLRQQIVVLKSLWDISSSLRARRLELILSNNWGEQKKS
jgi:hypothetical protein